MLHCSKSLGEAELLETALLSAGVAAGSQEQTRELGLWLTLRLHPAETSVQWHFELTNRYSDVLLPGWETKTVRKYLAQGQTG